MVETLRTKYAIIGAGTAGIAATEALRGIDPQGDLVMINGESVAPYCRPLIVELLTGERTPDQILLREQEWFADRRVTLLSGDPVVGLEPERNRITLGSGRTVRWEKLLIATGAQPARPPITGLSSVPVLSLSCQEDVAKLRPFCRPGAKALLVGIGLIGLQAMSALEELGVTVVAIEARSRVLPMILDTEAASLAQDRLEKNAIDVRVSTKLKSVSCGAGDGRGYVAETEAGEEIGFDFLVLATGMQPDLSLLNGAGIMSERGIIVNERMATNVADVYAAGDVTQYHNWIDGRAEVHAHWVNASHQGRIAGVHLAGGQTEPYAPLFLNSLRVFGLPIITMGASRVDNPKGADVHVARNLSRPTYTRLVVRQGKLIAATFVGDVERAGVFQHLMREQVEVAGVAASLLSHDRTAVEFLREMHQESIEGEVDWPRSMDLIQRYRKDHGHTRWGRKAKHE